MSEEKPKSAATLFDHLANITFKKTPWSELSEADRKSFSPYMINRWLSMNPGYIELVDELQKYTIGVLKPKDVYRVYLDFLPKVKSFNKYVKGSKEDKYSTELIDLLKMHFLISEKESIEYLDIYFMTPDYMKDLVRIIKLYGKADKEIQKLIKV